MFVCLYVLVCIWLLRIGEELNMNVQELDFEDFEPLELVWASAIEQFDCPIYF